MCHRLSNLLLVFPKLILFQEMSHVAKNILNCTKLMSTYIPKYCIDVCTFKLDTFYRVQRLSTYTSLLIYYITDKLTHFPVQDGQLW